MTQPATDTTASTAPTTETAKPPEAPTAETPPPPAPDPDAAFRIAAKARSDAHRRQQEARRATTAAETERAAIARERAALEADRAAMRADPIRYLQRAGVDGNDLAKHLAGPQQETADERVARLEAKLAEREEAETRRAQEAEIARLQAEMTAVVRQHAEDFGKFVDERDDEYPALVALGESDPPKVWNEWRRVQSTVAQSGYTYSNKEMAEYLENFSRPLVEKTVQRYQTAQQKRAAKSQPATTTATPSTKANGADAKAGTPRTLNAQLSAEKTGNGVPIDRLPEKEQNAVLAEMLRKIRKD